mgnify:CR=1 FL=1
MYIKPSRCPICGDVLTVTRLSCPSCDTSIEGRFAFTRLEQLAPDQLAFVEMFLRCDGKLSWLAQELKTSYPTVRGRLDEVIRALGYEVRDAPPDEEKQRAAEKRQAILDDLAAGKIGSSEALQLLQA